MRRNKAQPNTAGYFKQIFQPLGSTAKLSHIPSSGKNKSCAPLWQNAAF
jgi:hypothetical protein